MKVEVQTSKAILAQYNGRCSECNAAIRIGDPIVEVIATKRYVHPECVPVVEARF